MLSLLGRYRGVKSSEPGSFGQREDGERIVAHAKADMARYKRRGEIAGWWAGGCAALLIVLVNIEQRIPIFRDMFGVAPDFSVSDFAPLLFTGFVAIGVGGFLLALLRDRPALFVAVMGVATLAVLGDAFMGLRAGWAISGDSVAIRPAEPWKPDIVFTGAQITSLEQGCYSSHIKGGGLARELVFYVHYTSPGQDGDWGVGQRFTVRNATPDVAAHLVDSLYGLHMKPNIPRVSLPKSNDCVNFFTQRLDASHAAKFLTLVGPGRITGA